METTTMERLQMATDSYGAVVRYGNLVIATSYSWHKGGVYGNDARIYRLTETPSENPWQGKSFIECGLELIRSSKPTRFSLTTVTRSPGRSPPP